MSYVIFCMPYLVKNTVAELEKALERRGWILCKTCWFLMSSALSQTSTLYINLSAALAKS